MTDSRLRLYRLVSGLVLAAALLGLEAGIPGPQAEGLPELPAGLARARLDGGQMMGLGEGVRPNELSRLNLGHRVDFKSTRIDLLKRLPGLGQATIAKGRERGYLLDYQRRKVRGLLKNDSNFTLDKDNDPRSTTDDI
ncbi:hypothetical protein C4J81_09155 [Deltaproteobacteria bacterium Smac51]|nr:hypothetical protein C4J81_09155 [Deltaproteobacteria bacterium Smac51]